MLEELVEWRAGLAQLRDELGERFGHRGQAVEPALGGVLSGQR
jgi:hypothetical protein